MIIISALVHIIPDISLSANHITDDTLLQIMQLNYQTLLPGSMSLQLGELEQFTIKISGESIHTWLTQLTVSNIAIIKIKLPQFYGPECKSMPYSESYQSDVDKVLSKFHVLRFYHIM